MAGEPQPRFEAAYDAYAEEYLKRVGDTRSLGSVAGVSAGAVLEVLGDVSGLDVCDLGCGEGHLSRELAGRGARGVGVDVSAKLLAHARERDRGGGATYVQEDAQSLASFAARSFDVVVCNLALMDMPDLEAVYRAVARVLRRPVAGQSGSPSDGRTGRLVLSIMHPCFQAPYSDVLAGEDGTYRARLVPEYVREGFWRSKAPHTLRGKLGAHHRTLSTYVNTLLSAGFTVRRLREPVLAPGDYDSPFTEALTHIPPVLVIEAALV